MARKDIQLKLENIHSSLASKAEEISQTPQSKLMHSQQVSHLLLNIQETDLNESLKEIIKARIQLDLLEQVLKLEKRRRDAEEEIYLKSDIISSQKYLRESSKISRGVDQARSNKKIFNFLKPNEDDDEERMDIDGIPCNSAMRELLKKKNDKIIGNTSDENID